MFMSLGSCLNILLEGWSWLEVIEEVRMFMSLGSCLNILLEGLVMVRGDRGGENIYVTRIMLEHPLRGVGHG